MVNHMKEVNQKIIILLISIMLFTLIVIGCSNAEKDVDLGEVRKELILADQFGLAYAPLEIMKEMQFLETALAESGLESIQISWKKFGNTTAIREAMLSGDLDVGFVGIPPFLLGMDNGMDWKIISGLSESKVALVTKDPSIQSLADLTHQHKIILPQPGSIQHILLQMASKDQLGDANAFDDQIIALAHPDGVTAFTAGDLSQLHFTTPPYLQEDLKNQNARELIDGEACFGDAFTFIVGICQEPLYKDRKVYDAIVKALEESMDYMAENQEETIKILAEVYEYTPEALDAFLYEDQMTFTTEVKGIDRFVEFMAETGAIKKTYTPQSLFWESEN